MSQQLVKKGANGGMVNVNPKSWIEAIKDKNTGQTLVEILQGFNMYFLPYNGNTSSTRCLVPTMLRKKGLWITYVKYDGNVYTEWYAADEIDDKSWGDSSNWRVGNNTLVGDITISANGNWVINGAETEFKAVGEKGNTPLIRVANNRLQVSYDLGDTYIDVTNNPVYTKFRWLATSGDTQANNVGRIQASTDEGKTWTNMSNDFTNNLHISRYIGVNESLPTSGIAEGTIYAKGPYYDEGDTLNDNPIYRLWVYAWKGNTLAWQDNGEFQSIVAGVVQETGNSETQVMSQKAVSDKLSELGSKVFIKSLEDYKQEKCILTSQGTWYYYNNNGYHKAIPIDDISCDKVLIISENDGYIGFVTSEYKSSYNNGDSIPFVDGTSVMSISKNLPTSVKIPKGTSYIVFNTVDGGGNNLHYPYIELMPSNGFLSKLESDIVGISSFFSSVNLEIGSISATTGENIVTQSLRNNKYMRVYSNKLYFHQKTLNKDYYYQVAVACYTSDKMFIKRIEWNQNYEIILPNECTYIRTCITKTNKVTNTDIPTTSVELPKDEVYLSESPFVEDKVDYVINHNNKLSVSLMERGSVSASDGNVIKDDKCLRSKEYIKVDSSRIVLFSDVEDKPFYLEKAIGCYDENFAFVKRISWTRETDIALPDGTKYVKVVLAKYNKETKAQEVLTYEDVDSSISEGYGNNFLELTNNALVNEINRLLYCTLEAGTIWNDGSLKDATNCLRSKIYFPIKDKYIYLGQDTDTKDYYYQFAVACYDENKNILGRIGWSKSIQRELIDGTQYVKFIVLRSSKADNSDLDYSLSELADNEFYEGFKALLPKSESYNYTYKGNRIEIDNAVNVRQLFTMSHSFDYSYEANQASAVCGKYLLQFINANTRVAIYDLTTYKLVAVIENEVIPLLHNNCAVFGEKYVDSDLFPLIYLSGGNKNDCYVFRFVGDSVTKLKMELVQHITCNVSNMYYSNYMIDADTNKMLLFGYYGTTTDDQSYGVVVDLPNISLSEVDITDNDVIETFKGEYHLIQDSKIYASKLYVITGGTNSAELSVYGKKHQLINRISLVDFGVTSEPEGIAIYNGKMLIITIHGTVFELQFK